MSRRYHINPEIGVPSICRAEPGNCPYGGESGNENHFDSYSEAQRYSQEIFEKTYRLLPTSVEEDPNEIMEAIEERRRVKREVLDNLPKDNDYEITKVLRHTDDKIVIMAAIEGEIYENKGWGYTSAALQNPNISRKFLNEALFDYPEEFDDTTRRWLTLNPALTHQELLSIIENENEDMTMRSLAFRNPSIDKGYVSDIIDNQPHLLEKLPYSMIVHSQHKNKKTEEIKDEAFFFGTKEYGGMAEAELMTIKFVPWELKFRKEIEEERKS